MNKTQAKHTPTPWNYSENSVNAWSDSCKDRGNIFSCQLRTGTHIPENQNEINAGFIVRAVNSHEELLEACKRVLAMLEHCGYGGSNISDEKAHEKMLKDLIAKAEGK